MDHFLKFPYLNTDKVCSPLDITLTSFKVSERRVVFKYGPYNINSDKWQNLVYILSELW